MAAIGAWPDAIALYLMHDRGPTRHGECRLGGGTGFGTRYRPQKIVLVALAILPVRGVLFSFTTSPYGVVAIRLLDGVAAGIFGVISVLIASGRMRGTGRFNLAQGLTALAVGVGAALSDATAGYVVRWFGYSTGFLYLACITVRALIFFALLMPETEDILPPAGKVLGDVGPVVA
jgi:predicted MFS family arabinose efflux permease